MDVRDRMEKAKQMVEENAIPTQTKQKAFYDQKTRELNLQPGDNWDGGTGGAVAPPKNIMGGPRPPKARPMVSLAGHT